MLEGCEAVFVGLAVLAQGASTDCALFCALANYAIGLLPTPELYALLPHPLPLERTGIDARVWQGLAHRVLCNAGLCTPIFMPLPSPPLIVDAHWGRTCSIAALLFPRGPRIMMAAPIRLSDHPTVGAILELWFCCPPILPSPSPVLVALVHLNLINIYI